MMSRPKSVTIIGWWLILTGVLGAYYSATMELNPAAVQMAAKSVVPLPVQEIFGLINGLVIATSGIAFLKGIWWSRLVYLGWSLARIILALFVTPLWFIAVMLVFYVVILSIICRRSVNLWFESSTY
jgi:hypothetical protein